MQSQGTAVEPMTEGITGLLPSRADFERLGFRFGTGHAVDDVRRALPQGWLVGESAGRLLDDRGRPRTRAVPHPSGGERALSLVPRYEVRTVDRSFEDVDHLGLQPGRACVAVLDAGRPIRHSGEFEAGDAGAEAVQTAWLRQWLDSEHPDNRDPNAYWSRDVGLAA